MPFRKELKKILSEQRANASDELNRQKLVADRRKNDEGLNIIRGKEYLQQARGYFDQFLLPIFLDLATELGVDMTTDAYIQARKPNFLDLLTYPQDFFNDAFGSLGTSNLPLRDGFSREEKLLNSGAKVEGKLVWDYCGDKDNGAEWKRINLSVDNQGRVSGGGIYSTDVLVNDFKGRAESEILSYIRSSDVKDSTSNYRGNNENP